MKKVSPYLGHSQLGHLNDLTMSENEVAAMMRKNEDLYMRRTQFLCKHQHGFRSSLSCETQLVSAIHEWASILNIKGQAVVIQLEFSKAFDKVSHSKLLHKLSYYGIQGQTLLWIKGFQCNRSQSVSVNGMHSTGARLFQVFHKGLS